VVVSSLDKKEIIVVKMSADLELFHANKDGIVTRLTFPLHFSEVA
jgi:hypothetical protein